MQRFRRVYFDFLRWLIRVPLHAWILVNVVGMVLTSAAVAMKRGDPPNSVILAISMGLCCSGPFGVFFGLFFRGLALVILRRHGEDQGRRVAGDSRSGVVNSRTSTHRKPKARKSRFRSRRRRTVAGAPSCPGGSALIFRR
jgi:hypothetical protein